MSENPASSLSRTDLAELLALFEELWHAFHGQLNVVASGREVEAFKGRLQAALAAINAPDLP